MFKRLLLIALPPLLAACSVLGSPESTNPLPCEGGILNDAALQLVEGSVNKWDGVTLEQRNVTKTSDITKPGNDLRGVANFSVEETRWMFTFSQLLSPGLFGQWIEAERESTAPLESNVFNLNNRVKGTEPKDFTLSDKMKICVRIHPESGITQVLVTAVQ